MRIFPLFLLALVATPAAHATTLKVPLLKVAEPGELLLGLSYRVQCGRDWTKFRGLTGTVSMDDGSWKTRIELLESRDQLELGLGRATPSAARTAHVILDESAHCHLTGALRSSVQLIPLSRSNENSITFERVLEHAPFVVARKDQLSDNRFTDLPLLITYSWESTPENTVKLKYTTFYSDEDDSTKSANWFVEQISKVTSFYPECLMATYGRRVDIEWTYEVDLDVHGTPIAWRYQAPGAQTGDFAVAHKTSEFKGAWPGEYLPGSSHPVLYNVAGTNLFHHEPKSAEQRDATKRAGYFLVPRQGIPWPLAREAAIFGDPVAGVAPHPFVLKVSDLELAREHKLIHPAPEYLYVRVRGHLPRTPGHTFVGALTLSDQEDRTYYSGDGKCGLDRLGEDLWDQEAYTGIHVGQAGIAKILAEKESYGKLNFEWRGLGKGLRLNKELAFYRVRDSIDGRNYEVEDLTSLIDLDCGPADNMDVECRFQTNPSRFNQKK